MAQVIMETRKRLERALGALWQRVSSNEKNSVGDLQFFLSLSDLCASVSVITSKVGESSHEGIQITDPTSQLWNTFHAKHHARHPLSYV